MHVVIGGAFNGKDNWVKDFYEKESKVNWIDLSKDKLQIKRYDGAEVLVIKAIEELTKEWAENYSVDTVREVGRTWLKEMLMWEQENKKRQLVLIATDFSKGIVPIEKSQRKWRDITGWFYQDLIKEATRVDEVWYGLSTQLK